MQELYTYCIKNEEKFNYPKWSNLNRSVRIILGKKFKSEILKHSKKFEKGLAFCASQCYTTFVV